MSVNTNLEKLRRDRDNDTEWLWRYKRIVDGLKQIAEIQADVCNNDIDEWATMFHGLCTLSDLIQEDIDGRKEDAQ